MPFLHEKAEIIPLDGGTCFRMYSSQGELEQIRYPVFPGIDLIYNNIHTGSFLAELNDTKENWIEIDHCREGRLECQVDGEYFYLAAGDVSIHRLGGSVREECYPTSHYHGITIQIDLNQTPDCMSRFLDDVTVEPAELMKKFRLEENLFFALRQLPEIEHIFSELYKVPKRIRKGYFKVKILEIFLFLSSLEPEENQKEQRS